MSEMGEMGERVAKAIEREIFKIEVGSTPERRLLNAARAAIAEMRDPTERMRQAYRQRVRENPFGTVLLEGHLLEAWRAACDEALK